MQLQCPLNMWHQCFKERELVVAEWLSLFVSTDGKDGAAGRFFFQHTTDHPDEVVVPGEVCIEGRSLERRMSDELVPHTDRSLDEQGLLRAMGPWITGRPMLLIQS